MRSIFCASTFGKVPSLFRRVRFEAVYYKPSDKPQLILRHRTYSDDHELLAKAWEAAKTKARELGWIAQALSASVGALFLFMKANS